MSSPDAETIPAEATELPWLRDEVDRILAAVTDRIAGLRLPVATYRLQFNAQFTFRQAAALAPYLARMGISEVYASPLLKARTGSPHGYDVVAHDEFHPEIGTRDDFNAMSAALQQSGLGLILDIVPNHMAASPTENPWWWDVLENGPSSPYASHFDIDWSPVKSDLENKLLLPVLGDPFGKVLEDGELTVCVGDGSFWVQYAAERFPVAPHTYEFLLAHHIDEFQAAWGAEHPDVTELLSIINAIGHLPSSTETDPERVQIRQREKEVIKRRLRSLMTDSAEAAAFVQENVRQINGQRGDPHSFDRLDELLQRQSYRLAYWRVAADEINYRRFFDVNDLAAISMERPAVFEAAHRLVFELIDRGEVTGLRIDHPDGLYDPLEYFRQLQERRFLQLARDATQRPDEWPLLEAQLSQLWRSAGCLPGAPLSRPLYVVLEKILEHDEEMPVDWLTHGTVGYEFLNALGGLLVNPAGAKLCTTTYGRITRDTLEAAELAYYCKRLIVRMSMASELTVLAHRLDRISERNRWTRDFTLNSLVHALEEVISCFDVYRTYVRPERVLERDRRYIDAAVTRAARRNPATSTLIFDFIHDLLLLQFRENIDEVERLAAREFVGRFQQLTGPIMAKALEDTAFYRFNRLVSLNEVGGQPQFFGGTRETFHALNAARLPQFARGISATSTHDTKRGEDVRARISVLSEAAREWRAQATRWVRQNARCKTEVDGQPAPSRSDEYLLYQTLVGIWPGMVPQGAALETFVRRVQQYMSKVAHEAKVHTSWTNPRESYDRALATFVERLFLHRGRSSFAASWDAFSRTIAEHGLWNSLSQVLLKIASPGVADFYQGTEFWTLTLVDPDNRQPVDFAARQTALDDLITRSGDALQSLNVRDPVEVWLDRIEQAAAPSATLSEMLSELLEHRHDGRIKLWTTLIGLRARRRHPQLFAEGGYSPVSTTGRFGDHVVSFVRSQGNQRLLAIAPRWTVDVCGFGGPPPLGDRWGDTAVTLPADTAAMQWTDVFTGRRHVAVEEGLPVAAVLSEWPVALLLGQSQQ